MKDVTVISTQSQTPSAPLSTQNYNGIDLVKLLCSFFICVIHIEPFPTSASASLISFYLQQCICRVAVPFYFAVTGFLMFRSPDSPTLGSRTKNYIFRILRFYGLWYILLVWVGTAHLWYLTSSVVAVVLLYVCFRLRLNHKAIGILAVLLFLFGQLGGCYSFLLKHLKGIPVIYYPVKLYLSIFETTRNGIFFGFPFVFLGAALARRKKSPKLWTSVFGLAVSLVFMVLEVYFLKQFSKLSGFDYFISLIPATYFLMQLAITLKLKDRPIYKKFRAVSFLVFCTHFVAAYTVALAISYFKRFTGISLLSFHFLITIILVFGVSILIVQLSQKPRFQWLRYLYS